MVEISDRSASLRRASSKGTAAHGIQAVGAASLEPVQSKSLNILIATLSSYVAYAPDPDFGYSWRAICCAASLDRRCNCDPNM
jgi:hypothetical protein